MSGPVSGDGPGQGVLRWAVRSSFRAYVVALPDGAEQVSRGAVVTEEGRIAFPPGQAVASTEAGASVYSFRGTLTYGGHAGVLAVELIDPQVRLDPSDRGTVSVSPGAGRTGERTVIAAFAEWQIVDRLLIVPAPRLTWSGVAMLGDVYEVGDALDPIEIELDRA